MTNVKRVMRDEKKRKERRKKKKKTKRWAILIRWKASQGKDNSNVVLSTFFKH